MTLTTTGANATGKGTRLHRQPCSRQTDRSPPKSRCSERPAESLPLVSFSELRTPGPQHRLAISVVKRRSQAATSQSTHAPTCPMQNGPRVSSLDRGDQATLAPIGSARREIRPYTGAQRLAVSRELGLGAKRMAFIVREGSIGYKRKYRSLTYVPARATARIRLSRLQYYGSFR